MPHIHTGPGQHDHTVGAFIIYLGNDSPKILLHMHKKLNKLLPIGGHIELYETPYQAIKHEIREESGYTLKELILLQPSNYITKLTGATVHPYPVVVSTHENSKNHYHIDTVYAFVATSYPRNKVFKGESEDLRWFSKSELKKLDKSKIFLNTKEIYLHILEYCLNKWVQVPTNSFEV